MTTQTLEQIRKDLERQDRELAILEAKATAHRDVQLHIGEDIQEQLNTISNALTRRPQPSKQAFFVRM
jgi:hypothetical protein